jgi:bacterioferritin
MIGDDVREVLDADLKAEYRARSLYREGRDVAAGAGDHVTRELFERLMADEEGHIDFLETQIDLFDRIGEAEYGALNAVPTNEAGEELTPPRWTPATPLSCDFIRLVQAMPCRSSG